MNYIFKIFDFHVERDSASEMKWIVAAFILVISAGISGGEGGEQKFWLINLASIGASGYEIDCFNPNYAGAFPEKFREEDSG